MAVYYDKGRYRVRITGQDFVEPGNGKSDYIELKFTVIAAATHQGDIPEEENHTRSAKFYLSDKAIEYTNSKFASLGLKSWTQLPDLEGQEIYMVAKHERNNDQSSPKYGEDFEKWDIPGPGAEAAPIAPEKAKSLQAKYGSGLAAAFGANSKKPAPATRAVQDPASFQADDDDLPF